MKPENYAWLALEGHAAAQLRPGFADRVLRAVREADVPTLLSHFALSAATAAACLLAVMFVHTREMQAADERNIAEWQQIVAIAQELNAGP